MEAHVLHIGVDDCHRVAVLRSVGYRVDECATLPQLAKALERTKGADAVFMSESDGIPQEKAISLARAHTAAPLILFQNSNQEISYQQLDLVIEPLTAPGKWLQEVRNLLEWNRLFRGHSPLPESMWSMRKTRILQRDALEDRTRRSDVSLVRLWNPHPGSN
jgi:hypothetical protein